MRTPTSVTIIGPTDGAGFASGAPISFSRSAADPEDGDPTTGLAWTSSIDGPVGTGGSFSAVLSDGRLGKTLTSATYQVCEAGTNTCSNEVTVTW